jgi:hypothetical protein
MTDIDSLQRRKLSNAALIAQTQFNYSLMSLNWRFLTLLGQLKPAAAAAAVLPPHWAASPMAARLRQLSCAERVVAAQCPIALFDAKLEQWGRAEPSPAPAVNPWTELVQLAGALVWHSVRREPVMAALGFGLRQDTVTHWQTLSYNHMGAGAGQFSPRIGLRWPQSDEFWQQLLAASEAGDAAELRALRRLCVQLQGADML